VVIEGLQRGFMTKLKIEKAASWSSCHLDVKNVNRIATAIRKEAMT
jgi:hypothetical protein